MTLASQPDQGRELFLRQIELAPKRDQIHADTFPHGEHLRKPEVPVWRDDMQKPWSHNGNMATIKRTKEDYDAFREASGWYAAAWRDHRGMTLHELAVAVGSSRGFVSDMETGAVEKSGRRKRFNVDWLAKYCEALNVKAGDLIDTNPFEQDPRFAAISQTYAQLDEEGREYLAEMAGALKRKRG